MARNRASRTESHETETASRRAVRALLPVEFVDRDLTERDYGVDLVVEPYLQGQPTGTYLLLQIKGRSSRFELKAGARDIPLI